MSTSFGPIVDDYILPPLIQMGQKFPSLRGFKDAVADLSVREGWVLKVKSTSRQKTYMGCRGASACPFAMNAHWNSHQQEATVTHVINRHTCFGSGPRQRQITSSRAWLINAIPRIMDVHILTSVVAIQDQLRRHFNAHPSYQAVSRAKAELIGRQTGQMDDDFRKIPDYCRRVLEYAPSDNLGRTMAEVAYLEDDAGRHFQRVFISPGTGNYGSNCILPFIAIDGTYARNCFAMTMLVATGRDNNGGCFLLAWSLVESETEDAWRWFLQLLDEAYPDLNNMDMYTNYRELTIISDRGKGCRAADDVFAEAHRASCTWHLARNMEKAFGKDCARVVKRLGHANNDAAVNRGIKEVLEKGGPVS